MKRRGFLGLAAGSLFASVSHGADSPTATGVESIPSAIAPAPASNAVVAMVIATEGGDIGRGMSAAVASLTGSAVREGWGRFFGPRDRVAIKLNCLAGPGLSPRREVVDAVIDGIRSVGVAAPDIVLFDRSSRELERAGFPIQKSDGDVRCFGTDALKGGGYGDGILEHRSIGSLFTRILTDHATILVSVGVCKDHDLSGVSAGCKNLYGLIHNPNRYHDSSCDPFLADLLDHPAVRPKLRLTVVDAIEAQCHGGPARVPAYTFRPGRVLLSADPVAIDRIAWKMIDSERSRRGLPILKEDGREPRWIATAAGLGLGQADDSKIELREVEG